MGPSKQRKKLLDLNVQKLTILVIPISGQENNQPLFGEVSKEDTSSRERVYGFLGAGLKGVSRQWSHDAHEEQANFKLNCQARLWERVGELDLFNAWFFEEKG